MCCALWSVLTSRIVINIRAVGQGDRERAPIELIQGGRHRSRPSILPLISYPGDSDFNHEQPSPGVLAGRPRRERTSLPDYTEAYHVLAI